MDDIVRTGNGSGFEQVFKNIDDVLWKEAGCTTELDYTEQSSWMLFLKYLDDLEHERALKAQLQGKPYEFIIDEKHRWSVWAAPKKPDGSFDHDNALTGDDLIEFVDRDLFPYLHGFKQRAVGPDTIEYKIGEIFGEIKSKFRSGYSLRDAFELTDELRAIKRYLTTRQDRLPWLFVSERGQPLRRRAVFYLVHTAGESGGVSNVHPHMLRHSCGDALAEKGTDLRTMQDYLGHRDPRHTVRYTRIAGRRFEGLWK